MVNCSVFLQGALEVLDQVPGSMSAVESWLNFALLLTQVVLLAVQATLHMKKIISQRHTPGGGAINAMRETFRDAGAGYVALDMVERGWLDLHI